MAASVPAFAGVFNTPQFVQPGEFALGFEPEITFTNGAGLAGNFRYTQGLTDLNNLNVIVGTGGGPRRFRIGGNFTFDFFPDIDNQPGIGIAVQGLYYRLNIAGMDSGQFELTGIPYIHKAFKAAGGYEIQPFFALPFGIAFNSGNYNGLTQAVIGVLYKQSEHVRFSTELGFNINHTETYLSAGVIYYH
jgi:hypothetical protein